MKLGELVTVLNNKAVLPQEGLDREVFDIAHDSRKVSPGSLFVAVRGFHSDGHQFIPQAVQAGAVAIVAEKGHNEAAFRMTPTIVVDDSRRALALLAAAFYGHPSQHLILVGITGTNGKTTTTYLIKSIIEAAGRKAGLIGTIDYRVGDKVYTAPNTTPESLDLQRLLAEMVGFGVEYCVMEVSSHALALGRTVGCEFAVAGFTNLTQDHLDFHESMESYFRVKQLLFTGLSPNSFAVINSDDVHSTEIIGATRAKVLRTGLSERADIRPSGSIGHGIRGLSFSVATPSGTISVESSLVGRHNIYNILSAIGIGTALGFAGDDIARGINAMRAVPGRMEKVDEGQPFSVVADYAHTEDALVRLLETVREITTGKVITVFGCGGDRDRSKRPKMGAAAVNGSDIVIVTSDNPRTEDPVSIISEIEKGMEASGVRLTVCEFVSTTAAGKTPYCVMPDRHAAIAAAINMAGKGDVVVLAGKGHEDYQIIGDRKIHFDDREVAREELRKRRRT
ncbi:MAG TPA: UDP-N-acetylmuramoyl-L-alanyl-D-glutamate--2,6-diaminopimelate ligase [Nitrospirota bacterium]|nr:UDP-N-acetylmuramoyl-L-alanyl-D-glutamate--2,6-diaminopimelate ligase [Nitrospirota bacterium]